MNTSTNLLEAYLEAKDLDRPSLILECCTPNAILTYSIATDTISFPAKVLGADAIAQTLVRDFRQKFDRCKTYYLCDSIVERPTDRLHAVAAACHVAQDIRAPDEAGAGFAFLEVFKAPVGNKTGRRERRSKQDTQIQSGTVEGRVIDLSAPCMSNGRRMPH